MRFSCYFYAFVLVLLQLLFSFVCLPGCTFLPLPYIFGTVQKGAHLVSLLNFASLFFLLGCLYRDILFLFQTISLFNLFVVSHSQYFALVLAFLPYRPDSPVHHIL